MPLVITSHGGRYNPLMRLIDRIDLLARIAFKNVDCLLVDTQAEKEYFSRILGDDKRIDLQLTIVGVDFDRFKPLNKERAKEIVRLPSQKKVILYVGRLYKLKGADIIIQAFKTLKKKYDVELIMIGYHQNDPLIKDARAAGARIIPVIPQEQLVPYYNAADVFVTASFEENVVAPGGIGMAPIEALACNTPVVSPSLRHFPQDDVEKVGKIPQSPEDVAKCIAGILEDPTPYHNCRRVARRYYDWKVVVDHLIKIYDKLFSKYYG
ncbi:glycosyltransferase family 4 protein [Archaeoglobus sulfaticallidus]|nr:glycosyltransferase family 4 protein [Archaeoglobus sulfaticallidus]